MRPGAVQPAARHADHPEQMSKLRMIACTLAAAACALALSVGAALAEGDSTHATGHAHGKAAPAHLCFLHDLVDVSP
jgi:hypothetical protein